MGKTFYTFFSCLTPDSLLASPPLLTFSILPLSPSLNSLTHKAKTLSSLPISHNPSHRCPPTDPLTSAITQCHNPLTNATK